VAAAIAAVVVGAKRRDMVSPRDAPSLILVRYGGGRSPGSRVAVSAGLPGISPSGARWPRLAAHSCGGSSGSGPARAAPDSLFVPSPGNRRGQVSAPDGGMSMRRRTAGTAVRRPGFGRPRCAFDHPSRPAYLTQVRRPPCPPTRCRSRRPTFRTRRPGRGRRGGDPRPRRGAHRPPRADPAA
jgi:hypothetical protein